MKNIIVAYDQERAIGMGNGLMWGRNEMRADINHFRDLTKGSVIIMGRKTFDSIGVALSGRTTIVLTRDKSNKIPNVKMAHSLEEAYSLADGYDNNVFVVGGGQIFRQALASVDRIYATEVEAKIAGADTFFPRLDDSWGKIDEKKFPTDKNNIYPYNFVIYEKNNTFVNLDNARLNEQRRVMKKIELNQECPFCPENLNKYHKPEIIRKGVHWVLTKNQWPYNYTDVHLLAIATYHAEKLSDLREGSFDELLEHMVWAEKKYKIITGGIAMRFGDMTNNGATVSHIHVHLIVPSADKPINEKVRFKIS